MKGDARMKQPEARVSRISRLTAWAWLPIPVLLTVIAGLWVADLRTVYESRALMVLLNVVFTWLASLCICVLTARGFLNGGRPSLLMFGCGSLLWGCTSLAAACIVDRLNPTITVHNLGLLGAAGCHLVGLLWRGRLERSGRWLAVGYAGALLTAALVVWGTLAGWTPLFFVQGQGGTPVRQGVLLLALGLFGWVAWQMVSRFRRQSHVFYYWYGLGLGLVATGLCGVLLLSVQGGVLGWTNRLTQYLGSAYLLIAAVVAAREAGTWKTALAGVEEAWGQGRWLEQVRRQTLLAWTGRYGVAVGMVAAGWGLRVGLTAAYGPTLPTYITFYPGVMVAALVGGYGPGLAATILTELVVAYWILPPVGTFSIAAPVDRVSLVLFGAMGLFMSGVAEVYRRYRLKAAAYDREAALRETHREMELLARLLEQAEQPFAVGYPDGRMGRVNRAFEALTGYTTAELRALDWSTALTPPEWRESEKQKLEELTRTGQPVRYQKEYRRKDGARVPIELLVHLMRDPEGRPEYYYCFLTDITARRRAEQAARESAERQQRLNQELEAANTVLAESRGAALNLMDDALAARQTAEDASAALQASEQRMQQALRVSRSFTFEWEPATDQVLRSASCGMILMLEGSEAVHDTGQHFFQRVHPDDRARFGKMLGELKPGCEAYTAAYRVRRGDGSTVVLEETAQASFDAAGKLER